VVAPPIPQGSSVTVSAMNTTSPFIRISPPKDVSGPTVYWDLAAADLNGDGLVSLDMSGVPTPAAARLVRGRVQTTSPNGDVGIPSTVIIFGSALDGATALTASWGASRHTDADGIFFVEVFSGEYRVIALPDPSLDPSASWAITETHWSLHFDQTVDALPPQTIEVLARSAVTGHASVARTNEAAAGATLEAAPSVLTSSTDVLTGALAQVPINSLSRTASIGPSGDFAMYLDPGDFDFSLKPPDGSGFAWWVRPQVRIDPATPTAMSPTLASPIAIEGTIRDPGGSPLANAVVRSYAKTPSGLGVVKVGSARTDDSGSYRLLLPVDFGP
jgi:hypothetical protein